MPGDERGGCQGGGEKTNEEDIAGSNARGTRREERTRQGKEIGQIYMRGTVEDKRQRKEEKEEETRRRGEG